MIVNPTAKKAHMTLDTLEPVTYCAYSDRLCRVSDMRRQMEWCGESLVWTGLMVHKDYLDKPQPQNKVTVLPPDGIKAQSLTFLVGAPQMGPTPQVSVAAPYPVILEVGDGGGDEFLPIMPQVAEQDSSIIFD